MNINTLHTFSVGIFIWIMIIICLRVLFYNMDHRKQQAGIILDHSCDTRKKGEDDHEGIIVCAL